MNTIKLAYIGYGVLGKQVENLLKNANIKVSETLIFDDVQAQKSADNSYKFDAYKSKLPHDYLVCIGLGYKYLALKQEIQNHIKKQENLLLTFVHPSSYVASDAIIEQGVIIYPMCTIDAGVTIKSGALINNSVTISHDTTIGECCYISPGVVISGRVSIEERTFIGTGSLISNDVNIGADSVIGIGSSITKTVPAKTKGLGNPFLLKNIQL
ncbi:acetyltransferase [Kordia sp. YSTF-M3]|uniref:Acetyltransferase n=1 Tax=Kordia aestuariivivens TaxID=2759037 RepID=A0ABR7Q9A7_9FLAO|nr:acetyltransferase [Kordia aestuariivivens]MBC8755140.1 acetyltransferase [Kordia aestuariivivens]